MTTPTLYDLEYYRAIAIIPNDETAIAIATTTETITQKMRETKLTKSAQERRNKVLDLLRQGPQRNSDIYEATTDNQNPGYDSGMVRGDIKKLREAGHNIVCSRGIYTLVKEAIAP